MNLGSLIVLAKLFTDAVGPVSLVGPPAPKEPKEIPTNVPLKPICGPGRYAQKLPSGLWSCLVIPKGR
jgi:hypothetical protein